MTSVVPRQCRGPLTPNTYGGGVGHQPETRLWVGRDPKGLRDVDPEKDPDRPYPCRALATRDPFRGELRLVDSRFVPTH